MLSRGQQLRKIASYRYPYYSYVLYYIVLPVFYIILYYIVLYYIVLYNHNMKESPEEVVQSVKLSLASVDKANHGKFPINIFVNLG